MSERRQVVRRCWASPRARLALVGLPVVVLVAAGSWLAVVSVESTSDSTVAKGPAVRADRAPPACRPRSHRASATNLRTRPEELSVRGRYAPHGNLQVAPRRRVVALSFDDGPWPVYTAAVLRDLRSAHAHATFFVVGKFAARFPGLLGAEAAGGNEVANHTYDHQALTTSARDGRLRLSSGAVGRELGRTDRAICAAGLPRPLLFRPPYGRGVFSHELAMIVRQRGQRVIGWAVSIEHYLVRSDPMARPSHHPKDSSPRPSRGNPPRPRRME